MPNTKYLKVTVDGQQLDLSDTEVQVSIDYQQEDTEDFTSKKSSEAFSITVPASINNDQLSNTLHNPSVEDMTSGQVFRGYRKGIIEVNGDPLLIGKAVLVSATHTDRPVSYEYNFYGNNGDWIIPLKETTLYDLLKHIKFEFTSFAIQESWLFNGYSESSPLVFAPVRYGSPVDFYDESITDGDYKDDNMTPLYMKPSISVYWLLYWGFKLAGYKIQSNFFDTNYFRRLVMPWTWGNFLNAEGNRQDNLKFLAKGSQPISFQQSVTARYIDVKADNESTDGAYDNNGVYLYSPTEGAMLWVYPLAYNYGKLKITFNLQVDWHVLLPVNSELRLSVHWYLNETLMDANDIVYTSTPGGSGYENSGVMDDSFTAEVDAMGTTNSRVSARIWCNTGGTGGYPKVDLNIIQFTITDIATPLGGTIDFQNFNGLKNFKFLDLCAGIIDSFNIIPGTDPVNKVVLLEPAHPYSLTSNPEPINIGYFNGDYIDWNEKQDLSRPSIISLFSDYERELTLKFKDDSNDGILKLIQDRNNITLAAAKYVFPERFKAEKKDIENRFFSPVMHYEPSQWQAIGDTGKKIQMICIIPENVSNTSKDESGNTFQPKLAYYKGLVTDAGGWKYNGAETPIYPFMFAVNYQEGGANDPVLSYSDEKIGAGKAPGLLRRFFLQRFAIMRNGQYYTQTFFRLNNKDVTNWYHREHKICRGERWELVKMTDYRPLNDQSTECYLRKWSPITETDYNSVYPSFQPNNIDQFDTKYSPLKCLISDVPGPITE